MALPTILFLHYLVKFRSRSLAIYSNELILNRACVDSEMINWIATDKNNKLLSFRKSYVLHHIIFITVCA